MLQRLLFHLGCALLLAGCASPRLTWHAPALDHLDRTDAVGDCARLLRALDDAALELGTADTGAVPVRGYPYLRNNRFLADLRDRVTDELSFQLWRAQLRDLDQGARTAEIANLPAATRTAIGAMPAASEPLPAAVADCGVVMMAADAARATPRADLLAAAVAPAPAYNRAARTLGAYPISALLFLGGVQRLHRDTLATFAVPLEALPVAGQLTHYAPAPDAASRLTPAAIREALQRASDNALGMPLPAPAVQEQLFATFAPHFIIDVATDDDRIGTPLWQDHEAPDVDTTRPVVYRHLSHTRFDGEILLQLNYVIWFPSRPRSGRFDLLGGRLDGITWRVTLDVDGTALAWDSMHNCGCYHQLVLSERLRARAPPTGLQEPLLVVQSLPSVTQQVELRIASGTHYIQRISPLTTAAASHEYHWADYDALRALPRSTGGRRSLFRPDGIVAGTERGERWLFWPMGVTEPGAMRQWGHHATAFVGQRHFDDPELLERYSERRSAQ